ncbi:hypothetical protein DXG01_012167, partial [Tephrocybe rancida]
MCSKPLSLRPIFVLVVPLTKPTSRGGIVVRAKARSAFVRIGRVYGGVLVRTKAFYLVYRSHFHADPRAHHTTVKAYDRQRSMVAAFHIKKKQRRDKIWTYATSGMANKYLIKGAM